MKTMRKQVISILVLTLCVHQLFARTVVGREDNLIRLTNGLVTREIRTENGLFSSVLMTLEGDERNFIGESREFSFWLNGKTVDGRSGWNVAGLEEITDTCAGTGVKVRLEGGEASRGLVLEVYYTLYPDISLVRKWIRFINGGKDELVVEALNVEDLETRLSHVQTVVLHDYARMRHIGTFTGNWDDPVVVVHDQPGHRGLALGNEAPGVMKRTAYHTRQNNIEAGLTHPGQAFPFRKWLSPGEEWESPKTFICLYGETDDPFAVVDGPVNDFVRRHMVPRIVQQQEKPLFVYNTWKPFRTFVSDSLVRELASAAAQCGIKEFIIDDGWQVNAGRTTSADAWGNNYGDWLVDEVKFPGGLKSTFDYIDSLGMKPGLWMSIGSATDDAAVYREHPEWFVKNARGEPGNLHSNEDADFHTSCFGTDWPDYILEVISRMCNEYGLAYTKLDFSVVASAYVNDPKISGCYASTHPYHRDWEESHIVIYERLLDLFDRLHRASPDLFIDCTFETAGKLQLMDYAIACHAEGNWLANFEEPAPAGPLRIRHMAWWRSPALPAGSLVIGNTSMDDPSFEFALKSLIGTLPIVLGDPRKIPEEERVRIRAWADWMETMQERYDYMSYRRDLPGFGEPREGAWDGWTRINNDTREGGIVGVFRHGAAEDSRQVVVSGLDPEHTYVVRMAPEGEEILHATGRELMERGFRVEIPALYDGNIYEIGPE